MRGYVVERLLGGGGSGEVWRGRVAATGEPVALKRIPIADAEQARRARTEAALLTELDHPHLVRLHALVATSDASVLVLDLADGGSLAELLNARGRLTPGETITAVAPIAAALAYLHGAGVVHGDVSAANILFTTAGVPLLADVGTARLTGDGADAACTPAYADPAVAGGCVPGPPSDVFMLGAVALHALTGSPPWPAESGEAALALAARGDLDDVAQRLAAAEVPSAMVPVLARALTVDPHRRGTAADLALDLRHSGEPLAVELAAGRARAAPVARTGPRHAAGPATPVTGADRGRSVAASRPDFERPALVASGAGIAPPTRLVGPRPRPAIPRPPPPRRSRIYAALAALALLLAVAAAGTVWAQNGTAPHRHPDAGGSSQAAGESVRRSAKPPVSTHAAASPMQVASQVPRSRDPTAPTGSASVNAADVPAALRRLDSRRAAAFANRDPRLLSRVYLSGPLLRADAALLARLVPQGCGLTGARTRYAQVRAEQHGARTVVVVRASLPAAALICAGRLRAVTSAVGPATLRLELVATARGPRIATQRVM